MNLPPEGGGEGNLFLKGTAFSLCSLLSRHRHARLTPALLRGKKSSFCPLPLAAIEPRTSEIKKTSKIGVSAKRSVKSQVLVLDFQVSSRYCWNEVRKDLSNTRFNVQKE